MKITSSAVPAFTLKSVAASLLTILIAGVLIQVCGVVDRWAPNMGTEALSPAALIPFIALLLGCAGVYALTRLKLFTRGEFLCVLYATLIAAPLMSHGFWRSMLSVSSVIPRNALFDKLDALSPRLWLHGSNVLEGTLAAGPAAAVTTSPKVSWREVEVAEGVTSRVVVLANDSSQETSWIRLRVPAQSVSAGSFYLTTVLARARGLGPQSRYFCRLYYNGGDNFDVEAFTSRREEQRTALQRTGFVRVGKYGIKLPTVLGEDLEIEFGLQGPGSVEFHDAQFVDVGAIEHAYAGRKIISNRDYEQLPESERGGLTVRPDRLLSAEGISFLFSGYFPLTAWIEPVVAWASFLALLLIASFAVAVVMRKQWIQNERYPLPLAQVPFALLGGSGDEGALAAIWKNRLMWIGFGISLFWCIVRLAHAFNTAVPNVAVRFPLKPYFTDPGWGATWDEISFAMYAMILAIGLFMELNVLMSLVVGFLLFRMQFWFGEAYGLRAIQDYPFREEQILGSFMSYALLILVFTRKYLWRVLKMAVKGEREPGEALSYRTAFLLLGACIAGVAVWAQWMQLPAPGMIAFFLYMVAVSFVAAKLRAECGAPHALFTAGVLVIIPALGGIAFFGPGGTIFISLAGILFGYYLCVFNISGLQLEMLEAGRRCGVRPRHLAYTAALGLIGGIVIGGWVYLSGMYAVGADSYPLKAAHFGHGDGNFALFNVDMARATDAMTQTDAAERVVGRVEARVWGTVFASVVTTMLTVLRQMFAGFWFHPVGFILGPSRMMELVWGSLLMAWIARFMVLKLGGAVTVREKLLPFATGVFLGAVAAYAVAAFVNGYVFFFNPGGQRFFAEFF